MATAKAKAAQKSRKPGAKTTAKATPKPTAKTAAKPRNVAAKATSKAAQRIMVLVGTRKGAFILKSDGARKTWQTHGPLFLGEIINHMQLDARDGKTMLCTTKAGHLGPTLRRSLDGGKTWREASKPPAFPKAPEGQAGEAVEHVFWLAPGHASEPGTWYAGITPSALFISRNAGDTWEGVEGFNNHPDRINWIGGPQETPPDGKMLHSIIIDHQDPAHLMLGLSGGGVFESFDKGASWEPLNKGCEIPGGPDPDAPYGHDPHCMRMHPLNNQRVVQQNHCGIYLLDVAAKRWDRVGRNLPKNVGDIGFPMVLHPHDTEAFWVFPMDGSTVWPRTSIKGKPAVYGTVNRGKTWKRMDEGLPQEQAWWTVKRQAMSADQCAVTGVYFGTTSGEVWASADEGRKWKCIARHLPHIYSVEAHTL
jgi:photosystem II stability/assembly factor-like uncharacterized protein